MVQDLVRDWRERRIGLRLGFKRISGGPDAGLRNGF
jgi:hypothetical protein